MPEKKVEIKFKATKAMPCYRGHDFDGKYRQDAFTQREVMIEPASELFLKDGDRAMVTPEKAKSLKERFPVNFDGKEEAPPTPPETGGEGQGDGSSTNSGSGDEKAGDDKASGDAKK